MVPCHSCPIYGICTGKEVGGGPFKSQHLGYQVTEKDGGSFYARRGYAPCNTAILKLFEILTGYRKSLDKIPLFTIYCFFSCFSSIEMYKNNNL